LSSNHLPRKPIPSGASRVGAAYDRISRAYDLIADRAEAHARQRGLALLEVRRGERVLEIGAGTGRALVQLAGAAGPGGIVCGLDASRGMLRIAQRRLDRLVPPVRLLRGDARTLAFRDASFDAAFMSFTLELFEDSEIGLVLSEARRVLRVGGRLVVVCLAKQARPGLVTRAYAWLHRQLPHLLDCRPIPVDRLLEPSGFRPGRSEAIRLWGLSVAVVLAQR
jgi:demethylmenaquinone methyltransferase/2-methoxy-6-polyprenyl-1,4-benzoquinol methylase